MGSRRMAMPHKVGMCINLSSTSALPKSKARTTRMAGERVGSSASCSQRDSLMADFRGPGRRNHLSWFITPVGCDFYQTNGCVAVRASFAGSNAPQLWRGFCIQSVLSTKPVGRGSTYVQRSM